MPQMMGMGQKRYVNLQARYEKNAWIAPELSASRNGKGASHLVWANGAQRPKFSTKRYWMNTCCSVLRSGEHSIVPDICGKGRRSPTQRYTVMAALRAIAKITTIFVHHLSPLWYLQ